MNPKVFVSHASEDKERFVLKFAEKLRSDGIDAWLDKWEMLPGNSLVDKIFEEGIKEAQAFIIVLSKHSINKPWVKEELNAGIVQRINKGHKVIPIVLDNAEVPVCLQSTVWVTINDLDNYDYEFNRIVSAIFDHHDKPPVGSPPAYTQICLDKIQGLSKIDTLVLKIAGELNIKISNEIIQSKDLLANMNGSSIPENEIMESLEIFERKGFIEAYKGFGDEIPQFSFTFSGFDIFARNFIGNYDSMIQSIISAIVNLNLSDNKTIEEHLKIPIKIIEHIIYDLESRGYLNTIEQVGCGYLLLSFHNVSPELKRKLK